MYFESFQVLSADGRISHKIICHSGNTQHDTEAIYICPNNLVID